MCDMDVENIDEAKYQCDMCEKKEPDVLFSYVNDVCDGCYEDNLDLD